MSQTRPTGKPVLNGSAKKGTTPVNVKSLKSLMEESDEE
jgi:hypothetical protein